MQQWEKHQPGGGYVDDVFNLTAESRRMENALNGQPLLPIDR
jgi:hypothetical protein